MFKNFVFFDFDGVMVDSFNIAYDINRRMFPELTSEEYRRRFEGNINAEMGRLNKNNSSNMADFFGAYSGRVLKKKMINGIADVLNYLAQKYSLIIVSSTTTPIIKDYLQKYGVGQCFAEVLGNDVDKSKVKKFKKAFKQFKLTEKDCVFVTDTLGDIKEANEVNIKTIGVTWGVHSKSTLTLGRPMALVDKPKDIIFEVEKLFKNSTL